MRALVVSLLLAGTAVAQPGMETAVGDLHTARNDAERAIFNDLRCVCGCAHSLNECGTECGPGARRRRAIQEQLDRGASRDEVIAAEVARYGVYTLREPPNRGFNRLVWIIPVVAVLGSAGVIVAFARRATRRVPKEASGEAAAPALSAEEADRLDEELDKLDG